MSDVERERVSEALAELVALKDGPRDAEYERRKPLAWQAAREAPTTSEVERTAADVETEGNVQFLARLLLDLDGLCSFAPEDAHRLARMATTPSDRCDVVPSPDV